MTGSTFFEDLSAATSGNNFAGMRLDAERDAAEAQKVKDETEFVKTFLQNHEEVLNMLDNCESIVDIGEYLRSEFDDFLADKQHDEKDFWTD